MTTTKILSILSNRKFKNDNKAISIPKIVELEVQYLQKQGMYALYSIFNAS